MSNLVLAGFVCCTQKTAYEVRISDWSSDVCSSDLCPARPARARRDVGLLRRSGDEPTRAVDAARREEGPLADRKSVVWGKSVSVRVDLGGRRIIKKKKSTHTRVENKVHVEI